MSLERDLKQIFSGDQLRTDEEAIRQYARDWTTYFDTGAKAVVFPKQTSEVQELVLWARKTKTPLVPSGGRTGLSGAAVGLGSEIIVSFEKMNKILDWNPIDRVIRCQPGVITETLQDYALQQGHYFPVDFAARGSSQIGGNIATNAGGIKVLRYGLMRDWVSGLEVVTGSGEILRLNNSLVKNATGYDLRHLFIGSEGTLGFITEASLKVTQPPKSTQTLVLAVPSLNQIMDVYSDFLSENRLTAFEFFSDEALKYVLAQGHVSKPFEGTTPYYVLIEAEISSEDMENQLLASFEKSMEAGRVVDGTMSQSPQQAKDLWRLREDISESISSRSPYKNDVSVRISAVPAFVSDLEKVLTKEYPEFEVIWFGHIGDGNLHINILRPTDMDRDKFLSECKRVDQMVFDTVKKYQGSVSAEHGVGLTKKAFLNYTRSEPEIALMREIKKSFDPDGIINPGKLF